jgi:hypothetical protein
MPAKPKRQQARYDEKFVARAVELRTKGHLGLTQLKRKLESEGFKSPNGKELREQTIRSILLRENAWDPHCVNTEDPADHLSEQVEHAVHATVPKRAAAAADAKARRTKAKA